MNFAVPRKSKASAPKQFFENEKQFFDFCTAKSEAFAAIKTTTKVSLLGYKTGFSNENRTDGSVNTKRASYSLCG